MSNLTTIDDYVGALNIPFNNQDTADFELNYIALYECEILIKVLGYKLYRDFIDGLDEVTPLQKWLDLKNGAEFNSYYSSTLLYFDGLKKVCANWVYFRWLENNNEQLTGTGVAIANKENSTNFDKNKKMVFANNQAACIIGTELDSEDKPTLYNFLKVKEVDYPNALFSELGFINVLGI